MNLTPQSFSPISATAPQFYPDLVKMKTVSSLVGLLVHENADIVGAVIDLLQELTDVDAIGDNVHHAITLVNALVGVVIC
jgi:hypothetical protein